MRFRPAAYQAAAIVVALSLAWVLVTNVLDNLAARNIASGFAFLGREAGFEIGESALLAYSAADSYLKALVVGLTNTFRVALVGVALATALGTAIGLCRLSNNLLLKSLCTLYVEFIRNVPLLVQLFFWYAVLAELLPPAREALQPLPGVFLSSRGFYIPIPHFSLEGFAWDTPSLNGFNFTGGGHLSPEFATLLIGLAIYTGAFIAEIVRAGVLAVDRGQVDAARALGLPRGATLRHVVLPQALRLIVPPLTSQYLNLIKNSSLAVAIGYPDFVAIVNTTINQTGQAIEGVAIIMAAYLTVSLAIAALMNWYNARLK